MPTLAIRSAAVNWSGRSKSHDAGRRIRGPDRVGAQTDPAHRLHAAGDADVDRAGRDQAGDEVVGLLAEPHWQSIVVAPACSADRP